MLMTRPTIGRMLLDARAILNDVVPITGSVRYSDEDLIQAFNSALLEVRAKRPDAFLSFGPLSTPSGPSPTMWLRDAIPQFGPGDENQLFPLDQIFYPLCINYIVGKSELREDEFAAEGRAVALLNKFTTGLLTAAS